MICIDCDIGELDVSFIHFYKSILVNDKATKKIYGSMKVEVKSDVQSFWEFFPIISDHPCH